MNIRNLLASSFGNTLEWLDFGLFIYFSPIIGSHFFPLHNEHSATIAALGVFAAGFICRPLGGILFGQMGDHQGRVKTLRYSIFLISFTTLLIGLLPAYQQIGIWASILFTSFRLLQGLSIGGEFSGAMIYLAESSPSHRRGFFTSFAAIGANVGFLIATLAISLLQTTLSPGQLEQWGWRIAFIIAGLWGLLVLCLRLRLTETPAYQFLKRSHHIVQQPLMMAFKSAPTIMLKMIGLTCMGATFYYVFFGYMPNYSSQQLNIPLKIALHFESVALTCMLLLVPCAAILGDLWGRKNMLIITALGIIILTIPCFYLLHLKNLMMLYLALSIATVLSSMEQGNILTTIVELSPLNVRYSSIAFAYNVGFALFGGTAPLIVSFLAQRSNSAPAYYLIAMAIITFYAILTIPKNFRINLLDF